MESVLKLFGAGVALLAGYIFLRTSPYRKYRAEHLRSDRFALHVLVYSIGLYTLGATASSAISRNFGGGIAERLLAYAEDYSGVKATVILSVVFAPIVALADNLRILFLMRKDAAVTPYNLWRNPMTKIRFAAAARYVLKCNDAATKTLYRATFGRKPLMLTLKSGKVYVGQPTAEMRDPSLLAGSIRLIPIASGYRDTSTHKVTFTTPYKDMTRRMRPIASEQQARRDDPLGVDLAELKISDKENVEIDMQDIGVVVFWSEVQSLTIFNEDLYRAFQSSDT
jgi:hypothetical protein